MKLNDASERRCARPWRSRRGSVLLYSIIMLTALIAVGSLAVDYALVQSSKTQLIAAVDAAARAGAKKLSAGATVTVAQSAAIAVAAQNKVNGSALTLTTAEVVEGFWDSSTQTFTAH